MAEAARRFLGEHDFTSFAASDPDRHERESSDFSDDGGLLVQSSTNIRTIYESVVERRGEELFYSVCGNGFLHHMVRNIVGTLLIVGKGNLKPNEIQRILDAKDRSAAGATAPASGLYLVKVEY